MKRAERMTEAERFVSQRFPRSSEYHPEWITAGVSGGATQAARQGLQAAVPGAGLGLSPSIPVRSKRLELGLAGEDVTIARQARRWSRAKVKWEMSAKIPSSRSNRNV